MEGDPLADVLTLAWSSKAFRRMDVAPILSIEIAQNKAYTALFGVPTQGLFDFIQRDPSLLAGIPTLARVAAYGGGLPIKVDGEVVGAIEVSGAPTVQNDIDCESGPGPRTRCSADRLIVLGESVERRGFA
jgi:uncharacterized protein GlcG (DUF336 family)